MSSITRWIVIDVFKLAEEDSRETFKFEVRLRPWDNRSACIIISINSCQVKRTHSSARSNFLPWMRFACHPNDPHVS